MIKLMSIRNKVKHFGTRTETTRTTCIAVKGTGTTTNRAERTAEEREKAGLPEL